MTDGNEDKRAIKRMRIGFLSLASPWHGIGVRTWLGWTNCNILFQRKLSHFQSRFKLATRAPRPPNPWPKHTFKRRTIEGNSPNPILRAPASPRLASPHLTWTLRRAPEASWYHSRAFVSHVNNGIMPMKNEYGLTPLIYNVNIEL